MSKQVRTPTLPQKNDLHQIVSFLFWGIFYFIFFTINKLPWYTFFIFGGLIYWLPIQYWLYCIKRLANDINVGLEPGTNLAFFSLPMAQGMYRGHKIKVNMQYEKKRIIRPRYTVIDVAMNWPQNETIIFNTREFAGGNKILSGDNQIDEAYNIFSSSTESLQTLINDQFIREALLALPYKKRKRENIELFISKDLITYREIDTIYHIDYLKHLLDFLIYIAAAVSADTPTGR